MLVLSLNQNYGTKLPSIQQRRGSTTKQTRNKMIPLWAIHLFVTKYFPITWVSGCSSLSSRDPILGWCMVTIQSLVDRTLLETLTWVTRCPRCGTWVKWYGLRRVKRTLWWDHNLLGCHSLNVDVVSISLGGSPYSTQTDRMCGRRRSLPTMMVWCCMNTKASNCWSSRLTSSSRWRDHLRLTIWRSCILIMDLS